MADIDLSKLSMGDKVIGVSGIALFIFSFFKWLGGKAEVKGVTAYSTSSSAWSFTVTLLAVLIGIAMVAIVVLKLLDIKLPELGSVTWGQVMLGMGGLVVLLVVIKVLAGQGNVSTGNIAGYSVTKTRKIGAYLGVLASAGLAYGGFLKFKEEKAA